MEDAAEGDNVVIERLSDRHLVFNSISSYRADISLLSHPFTIFSIFLSPLLLKDFFRRKTARYLLASLLFPLLLIFNPWTATLIGKLITAAQIWRLSWSFPISLVLGYVLYQYIHLFISSIQELTHTQLSTRLPSSDNGKLQQRNRLPFGYLTSFSIIILLVIIYPRIKEGIAFLHDRQTYYVVPTSEIQVGEFLEFNNDTTMNTLTDEITARTLLGVSSDLHMIRYRANWPYDPALDEQMDHLFRNANKIDTEIISFLDNYEVEILVLKNGMSINNDFKGTPSIASSLFENDDFTVYQIQTDLLATGAASGDVYYINGDFERARSEYDQALNKMPNNPYPVLGLGRINLEQGNRQKAIELFQKALVLSSQDEHILKIISDDLGIENSLAINYVMEGESYQGAPLPNEAYNFIDHVGDSVKSTSNNQAYIRQSVFLFDKKPLGILFQHPPSQVSFDLEIPLNGWIQFSPVLAPEVWQFGKGDGVNYEIEIETQKNTKQKIYEDYFDPKNIVSERTLITKSISLARWSGQTVKVNFITGCGPNNDCRFDWAGWGEPRILQPIAFDFLSEFNNASPEVDGEQEIHPDTLTIDGEQRSIIYQHPSSRLVYQEKLPLQSELAFGIGMDPQVWSPDKGDGVEYNIYVQKTEEPNTLHRVFNIYIDPKNNPDDRHWFDEWVNLDRFGGQAVDIIFEALPGPKGNSNFDWGGWSQPILLDNSP